MKNNNGLLIAGNIGSFVSQDNDMITFDYCFLFLMFPKKIMLLLAGCRKKQQRVLLSSLMATCEFAPDSRQPFVCRCWFALLFGLSRFSLIFCLLFGSRCLVLWKKNGEESDWFEMGNFWSIISVDFEISD